MEFAKVSILGVVFEHGVDYSGKLMSGCFDGQLRTVESLQTAVGSTESTMAMIETSGSKAKSLGGTIGGFYRGSGNNFAAGYSIVGSKT
jgi:hypothetical protein